MFGKIIRFIYHQMQRRYLSFRILVWLKEKGVTRRINFLISHKMDDYERDNPTEDMKEAQKFFFAKDNQLRVEKIYKLLADNKSCEVLKACIDYRTFRSPIPNSLYSENDQYFVKDIIDITDYEVFIDGGAYIGDTIQQFIDVIRNGKEHTYKIIAYEPDERNYLLLQKYYGKHKRVLLQNKGLSNKKGILLFDSTGVTAHIVSDICDATDKIEVVNIDDEQACKNASYIKMDIEGSEWDALHGAEKIIRANKPKLAICIYHSNEDMLRIIEYVHTLVPEHKLFVRHHSKSDVETVLYAVI